MPLVKLNSAMFDTIEAIEFPPDPVLDHAYLLDTLVNGIVVSDWSPIQVSAALIRLGIEVQASPFDLPETFQLRIEGSGIGPVSSMNALIDAINSGLATGAISRVSMLWQDGSGPGATLQEILSLSLNASGYVLSSGAQSLVLEGSLPLTFTQLYDLADLYTQVLSIDSLTRAERQALFADLASYGIQGLEVIDNGATYLGLHVNSTTASLSLAGLTFSLTGTFPDNFGEDLSLLWEAARIYRNTGDMTAVGDFLAGELAISSFEIADSAGKVLASIANPLDGTAWRIRVDGILRHEVDMGTEWDDTLYGQGGDTNSAIGGLGGNDTIYGLRGNDHLIGGSGRDALNGGAGLDRLDGGTGRDVLTGGTGADMFMFNRQSGADRITDFEEGIDLIQITGVSNLGRLTFTQTGSDVLVEFRTLDILVEDTTVALLAQAQNFQF